jgi:hypothetical protein
MVLVEDDSRAGQEHPSHTRKTLTYFSVKAPGEAEVRRITRRVVTRPGRLHGSKPPELYRRLDERRAGLGKNYRELSAGVTERSEVESG